MKLHTHLKKAIIDLDGFKNELNFMKVAWSEMWAAEWLLGPDGDVLRQPAMVPILDGVPYGCRAYIISRYCQVVRDLSWAVQENARAQTDASHKRLVGA